ncbi:MAG: hypothetical protein L5655_01330 [Thermosediminibacteraceae bacterium]|nr:hypothetical protein [Thermosediminibacteraceae bacterium]
MVKVRKSDKKLKGKPVPPLDRRRFKGELIDDERPEKYELSKEFEIENPMKTPPNNLTTKNREKKEKNKLGVSLCLIL